MVADYAPGGNTALGSHDQAGVFGATSIAGGARVVWHYRAADERRTFTVSYRVIDGAVAYDDVIDVGWAVWGDQWDFDLERLGATLANPALDPADPDYRVWGHPRSVEGETIRGDGVATLEAADVPDHTLVEMRVTIPRVPGQDVSGARIRPGQGLPKILAAEQALDDDYNSTINRVKRWLADHALWLSLALMAVAALILLALARLAREHPASAPEYFPEPPDDAPPALAYGLAHEAGDSADTVLATLLDLVDRGYYETSSATTDEEKLDLALTVAGNRPSDAAALTDYEREVLSFFDQLLEQKTIAISAMKDEVPQHSAVWRERWERMTERLDAADEGQLSWDRNLNGSRWLLAAAVTGLFTLLVFADISVNEEFVIPAAIGVVTLIGVIAFPRARLRRIDAAHRERTANWQAFARWTEDFPRLEDDPPATLELWKRILVYGVAFGTADRMIESGRIPAPVTEEASATGYWGSYAFAGSLGDNSFDGSAFSSSFASQVAPESSSSGGGGGFSGGGGGFSGGGGGGSW